MLQSVRGLREESGYYFPREFDAKFDISCVCLQVICSAGVVDKLKLTVDQLKLTAEVPSLEF